MGSCHHTCKCHIFLHLWFIYKEASYVVFCSSEESKYAAITSFSSLLGFDVTQSGRSSVMYHRNILPLSPWLKSKPKKKLAKSSTCCLFPADFLLDWLFNPENRGSIFLWNLDKVLPNCMASHPKGSTLHGYFCETLKSNNFISFVLFSFCF
jgi:hypothetical protein